jgi:sugar phosphate isomerase/epimerase
MDIGIQLYSVRDITEKGLKDALRKIAEIGYKSVEFAGFFGNSAEDVKSWLEEFGLRASGTHTQAAELLNNFDATVEYHKKLGVTDIIIPFCDLSTKEKIDELVSAFATLAPKLAAEGITLHYHNHDFEFVPNKDGLIPYDYITETPVSLEIDTYWAYAAEQDPLALLDKYHDRMKFYHIKDGLGGFRKGENGRPLGKGTAPVAAVYAKAKEYGLYPVVESETLTPSGLDEAQVCFDYLKTLAAE